MFDPETTIQESEKRIARIWRMIALTGVASIAFGVTILVWPNIGLSVLIALFGAYALVMGSITFVSAFNTPMKGSDRAWLLLQSLICLAAGVAVLVWPNLSAVGLLYAIAALAIAFGVAQMGAAFALPISGGRSLLLLLSGMITAAFGVVMFAKPGAGAIALLALIGAFALVSGITEIGYAIELRKVAGELDERVRRVFPKPVTHG
ncbi:MAG: DUF308 domain-containing protein [Actinobacteria bacterium]|nr:DUF308 domain-containing protein [Actinomycetota bacterium]